MTELFKELLGVYKEKTKLPIVSTYVILLLVWNWDIISIYLFSSVNMETRICWIKNIVPDVWNHISRILCPAIISFIYPFITNKLMYYTDKWLNNSITDRMEILNQRRITTAKARFKIKEEELGTSDLKQLEEQIKELEGKRDSLTSSLESANASNSDLSKVLDKNKSEIIQLRTEIREKDYSLITLENQISELEEDKESLENRYDAITNEYSNNYGRSVSIDGGESNRYNIKFEKIEQDLRNLNFDLRNFIELTPNFVFFNKEHLSNDNKVINYFLDKNLIQKVNDRELKEKFLLTTNGLSFHSYLIEINS